MHLQGDMSGFKNTLAYSLAAERLQYKEGVVLTLSQTMWKKSNYC